MIIGKFSVQKPDDVEVTLNMTTSLGLWKKIAEQLGDKWPGCDLHAAISDLVRKIEKTLTTDTVVKE